MSTLVEVMLEPVGEEAEMALGDENCGECGFRLENAGPVAGLIGEDTDGLPGFALFHEPCLSNRLLRLL